MPFLQNTCWNKYDNKIILNTINMTFEQVFQLQPNMYSRSLFLEAPQNL